MAQWKKDNDKAMVMLMSAVHADHLPLVTTTTSAHNAWITLRERYDRDTAHSTTHQFRQLVGVVERNGEIDHGGQCLDRVQDGCSLRSRL
ncbi:hypothetical protein ACQKWADRAFT_123797 [Trichoderma austrokoningii]